MGEATKNGDSSSVPPLRALEFYSGVGGMHCAVERARSIGRVVVVGAYDLNDAANRTYRHNFPDTPLRARDLASLGRSELEAHAADIWLMSPPCQPYSRNGKQAGADDPRAKSFAHLLALLLQLSEPPSYLLLENVFGFERSESRVRLVTILEARGYHHQEFLLSPTQFSIPNQRLRYFMLAKRGEPFAWCPPEQSASSLTHAADPLRHIPYAMCSRCCSCSCSCCRSAASHPNESSPEGTTPDESYASGEMAPLSLYLEPDSCESALAHRVPDSLVVKKGLLFDIVGPDDRRSCCFTKAYTRFVEGAGSVLRTKPPLPEGWTVGVEDTALLGLGLRYFTPREVARLHAFPERFNFPEDTSERQKYQQLGNSLNVLVVAELLHYLFLKGPPKPLFPATKP